MTNDELYKKFGPKLIDVLVQVILEDINLLRAKVGLPLQTNKQVVDVISDKLENMADYVWMNDKF